jgi:hypothetical protein
MTVMNGVKMSPLPRPVHTPCAKKTCQYVVEADVVNVPRTIKIPPVATVLRK